MLSRHNTRPEVLPVRNVFAFLGHIKTPLVYNIGCKYRIFYVGQNGDPSKIR